MAMLMTLTEVNSTHLSNIYIMDNIKRLMAKYSEYQYGDSSFVESSNFLSLETEKRAWRESIENKIDESKGDIEKKIKESEDKVNASVAEVKAIGNTNQSYLRQIMNNLKINFI